MAILPNGHAGRIQPPAIRRIDIRTYLTSHERALFPMKKVAIASIPLLLILALAIAGCGKQVGGGNTSGGNTGPANTIGMDSQNFSLGSGVQKELTVKAGTPVTFDDSITGGGYHIICVGKQPSCDASGDGPAELYGKGVTFQNGDKKDFTFTKAGTYTIICTVHSNMVLTLTVQ
jgi:plastocyanin